MRTSKREQLVIAQRKALEANRSTLSKLRKAKRKEEGKAEDAAKAVKRSPAGKKAAETLKTKRGIARKQEQANYKKTRTRASARLGGRRKHIQEELHETVEG
jgi:hypothetical protein